MARQLKLPVPVHIVTGGLGAGKTTFLQALLKNKPPGEHWALVINEFGAVGIDQAVLQSASPASDGAAVNVKELAGGCMCCTLSGVTSVAIAQLLRATKPDRMWIEPSGLGHPAALVDVLRGEHLASALDLQPIICLVDCVQFRPARLPWGAQPAFWANELCRDQVSIADILVGSKADQGGREAVRAFTQWSGKLFPAKLKVLTASHGVLDSEAPGLPAAGTLGLEALSLSVSSLPQASTAPAAPASETAQPADARGSPAPAATSSATLPGRVKISGTAGLVWLSNAAAPVGPLPGRPLRKEARDDQLGMIACGWVFHLDDIFARPQLQRFLDLAQAQVPRVKGVFRVSQKTWVAAAVGAAAVTGGGGGGGVVLEEIAYRRDSRLELIVPLDSDSEAGGGSREAGGAADGHSSGGASELPKAVAGLGQPGDRRREGAGAEVLEPDIIQTPAAVEGEAAPVSSSGNKCAELDTSELAAAIRKGQQGDWSVLDSIVLTLLLQS